MSELRGIKVLIDAEDMNRLLDFYRDTFGLEVKIQSEHWSELVIGTGSVALHSGGAADRNVRTGLSFTVTDLDTTAQLVEKNGGTVVLAPYNPGGEGIRLADFLDPENNAFMASQDL